MMLPMGWRDNWPLTFYFGTQILLVPSPSSDSCSVAHLLTYHMVIYLLVVYLFFKIN